MGPIAILLGVAGATGVALAVSHLASSESSPSKSPQNFSLPTSSPQLVASKVPTGLDLNGYLARVQATTDATVARSQAEYERNRRSADEAIDHYKGKINGYTLDAFKPAVDWLAANTKRTINALDSVVRYFSHDSDSQAWADSAKNLVAEHISRGFIPYVPDSNIMDMYSLEQYAKSLGEFNLARIDSYITERAKSALYEMGAVLLRAGGDPNVTTIVDRIGKNPFGEFGSIAFGLPGYQIPPKGTIPGSGGARSGPIYPSSWWMRENVDPAILAGLVAAHAYGAPASLTVPAALTAHQTFWAQHPPNGDDVPAGWPMYPVALAWLAAKSAAHGVIRGVSVDLVGR